MFIRTTTTRQRGATYSIFRLVESIRIGGRVRQRNLLNLGADFSFERPL